MMYRAFIDFLQSNHSEGKATVRLARDGEIYFVLEGRGVEWVVACEGDEGRGEGGEGGAQSRWDVEVKEGGRRGEQGGERGGEVVRMAREKVVGSCLPPGAQDSKGFEDWRMDEEGGDLFAGLAAPDIERKLSQLSADDGEEISERRGGPRGLRECRRRVGGGLGGGGGAQSTDRGR